MSVIQRGALKPTVYRTGTKSSVKLRSIMVLMKSSYRVLVMALGGVHKLRLQDEVGRWLSKCQQMLTEVGRSYVNVYFFSLQGCVRLIILITLHSMQLYLMTLEVT